MTPPVPFPTDQDPPARPSTLDAVVIALRTAGFSVVEVDLCAELAAGTAPAYPPWPPPEGEQR